MLFLDKELMVTLAALLVASKAAAQHPVAPSRAKVTPVEIVLVEAETVTPAAVSQWGRERFKAVAGVLDERTGQARYREVARHTSDARLARPVVERSPGRTQFLRLRQPAMPLGNRLPRAPHGDEIGR